MSKIPENVQLIIFDCDGVLVDSEPISNRIMAKHISQLGWPMDADESTRIFKGGHMDQIIMRVSDHLGKDVGRDWLVDFNIEQLAALKDEIKPVPGVRRVVELVISAGLKICVASQARKRKMDVTLGATGLLPLFGDRIFSASEVPRPKPYPDVFLHAAKSMETHPKNCLVIEDSVSGVRAALAAGMSVWGYDPENTGLLDIDSGVRVFTHMDEFNF